MNFLSISSMRRVLALSIPLLMVTLPAAAFEVVELSSPSGEVGDGVRVTTSLATYNSGTFIEVVFSQGPSGALVEEARVSPLSVVPNSSIDFEIPPLPLGQYVVTVEIDSTINDPVVPGILDGLLLQITEPRTFNFNVTSWLPAIPSQTTKDVDFGDVDNDGDLDIWAFRSLAGSFVDVLLENDGLPGGTLGNYSLSTGAPPVPAGAAGDDFEDDFQRTYDGDIVDLNGDGFRDIIRSDRDGVHLFLNQGDGTFVNRPDLLPTFDAILNGTGVSGFNGVEVIDFDGVATADIDNDGDQDVVLANYLAEGGVRGENLLLINAINTAAGRFVIANRDGDVFDDTSEDMTHGVIFGDVDGDGDPDLFKTNVSDGQKNRLLINQGVFSGTFADETDSRLPVALVSDRRSVDGVFEDFDRDGDLDLYIADRRDNNNLLWNDGGGNFTDLGAPGVPEQPEDGNQTYDVVAADLDFDGDIDIVDGPGEAENLANEARVLVNRGGTDAAMRFEVRTGLYQPSAQHRLTVDAGDVDFDLDFDLITGGGGGMTLYENDLFNPSAEDTDLVVMIDRTFSMVSGHDYFTPVKNIGKAIVSQKRPDDRVSIVTYDYAGGASSAGDADDPGEDVFKAETVLTLDDSASMSIADLQTAIADLDIGPCRLSRCTSIGQALRKGLGEVKPDVGPERIKVLALLTDGRQNLLPDPETVVAGLAGGFPSNVRVYTIALGTDTDNQALSDISSLGSGFYVTPDSLELAGIFEDLESDATGKQVLPSQAVGREVKPIGRDEFQSPRTLSFERFDEGTLIQEQFVEQGVTFTNDRRFVAPRIVAFGQGDVQARVLSNQPADEAGDDVNQLSGKLATPLTVRFARPQARVAMLAHVLEGNVTGATLTAFDATGVQIGSTDTRIASGQPMLLALASSVGDIAAVQLEYGSRPGYETVSRLMFEPDAGSAARERSFFVGAGDRQIRALLSWQDPGSISNVRLVDPASNVITPAPGTAAGEIAGDVFHLFKIKGPAPGTWRVRYDPAPGARAYLSVMATSDLKLTLAPTRRRFVPGEAPELEARLVRRTPGGVTGVQGATFDVQLTTSTGGVTDQVEVDESEGGRYRLRLPTALAAGTYQVLVTAVVESGDKVQRRRRQASLVVTPRQPGEVCDERSAIRVDPAEVAAARNLEVKVVATLRDCDGKPLRVEPDRISLWTSAGRFAGEGPRQTGEGVFTQILNVPGTPGRVTVRPVVGVQKLDTMATLDVGAGPVDPVRTRLHLAVSPGYVKADGDMEAAVHVEPVDQFGNPLTGDVDVEIEFHEPVTAEWLSPVRPYSDSGYERIFMGGTETGEALVIGKVNGVPLAEPLVVNIFADDDDLADLDDDDRPSLLDNCPFKANADQADSDADGIGDACEPEFPAEDSDAAGDGRSDNLWIWLCLALALIVIVYLLLRRK